MIVRYDEESTTRMFTLVEQWQESGLSQKAFSALNGIKISQFNYWVRKHERINNKCDFIQLLGSPPAKEIVLKYPSGVNLILPHDFAIEAIKSLVQF